MIAGRIPGRTDNEIKNFWNTHLSKKLINKGIDPRTHKPFDIANPKPNSNEHPSWSVLSHNPNPNPNHHSCFEERSESRKHECNSQTPPAEDIDDRRGNARVNSSDGLKEKSFSSTSTVWDDELAYAMKTPSHAEENMAIVFDNHPLV